jgi:hypothetical protein
MNSEEPARAVHPTIYHVQLSHKAAVQFEADPVLRAGKLAEWSYKAAQLGKRSVQVMGPYRQLAQIDLQKEKR